MRRRVDFEADTREEMERKMAELRTVFSRARSHLNKCELRFSMNTCVHVHVHVHVHVQGACTCNEILLLHVLIHVHVHVAYTTVHTCMYYIYDNLSQNLEAIFNSLIKDVECVHLQ